MYQIKFLCVPANKNDLVPELCKTRTSNSPNITVPIIEIFMKILFQPKFFPLTTAIILLGSVFHSDWVIFFISDIQIIVFCHLKSIPACILSDKDYLKM